jgi:hypothetical protein
LNTTQHVDTVILDMLKGLTDKISADIELNNYSEAQKDIVLLIRGGNILFKELTGVDYQ